MTDQPAYGQAGTQDTSSRYGALAFMIDQIMSNKATVKVVQVKSVAGGGLGKPPSVNVQIMTNQRDGAGNVTPHGIINNVPVFRLQGGKNAIIIDPVVGDIGIMVCADRDISSVKATGQVSNPGSYRQFDMADGIYLGGILNQLPEQYVFFTGDNGVKVVDKNNNQVVLGDQGVTITDKSGSVIDMSGGTITMKPKDQVLHVEGAVAMTGDMTTTDGSLSFINHIHPQGPDSNGDTEQDTGPPKAGT